MALPFYLDISNVSVLLEPPEKYRYYKISQVREGIGTEPKRLCSSNCQKARGGVSKWLCLFNFSMVGIVVGIIKFR